MLFDKTFLKRVFGDKGDGSPSAMHAYRIGRIGKWLNLEESQLKYLTPGDALALYNESRTHRLIANVGIGLASAGGAAMLMGLAGFFANSTSIFPASDIMKKAAEYAGYVGMKSVDDGMKIFFAGVAANITGVVAFGCGIIANDRLSAVIPTRQYIPST